MDCSSGWNTNYHCNECHTPYSFPIKCDKRTCPSCGPRLANNLIVKYEKIDKYFEKCFFVTLTLKNVAWGNLRDGLKRQRECFKKLCRREPYNRWFAGGIYAIEVTVGAKDEDGSGTWNVHMHVALDSVIDLMQAPYFYNRYNTKNTKFSRDWLDITGDSFIVDWQKARYKHKAVEYCLKYVSDPKKLASMHNYTYWLDKAFRGMRLLSTFGHLYGGIIEVRPKAPFVCPECQAVDSLVFDGSRQDVNTGLGFDLNLLDVGACEWV